LPAIPRSTLAELIGEAHLGIKVIPWFEWICQFLQFEWRTDASEKPEWAARLATCLTKNGFEWMNALDPQVQEFY